MKTALTIAGSDSSGGAGIQADIKTMTANGVFAMSAITALTAQNTTGVTAIFDTTPQFLAQQLDAVFTDIYPDAVKIGMVSSAPLIDTIAERLHFYGAKHIVVDPVMVATSGAKLLQDDAVQALTEKLLPLAEVLTPNIPEAEILSGMSITNAADMEAAARAISERYGCAVLCKGGHQINDADDLLWQGGTAYPQHPGSGDSVRHDHCQRRRHGSRCPHHQPALRLRRAVQGRPPDQRCRRPFVAQRHRQVVQGQAHRKPQHPRHRLHPVQRHRFQSCQGVRP